MEFRCGLVGLGRIGCGFDDNPMKRTVNTHAGAYTTNKKTKLVALCDIDKSKLEKYGKKYHVLGLYKDYHEMFEKEKLDCVSICTLADTHLKIVKEAAIYGIKGIFLEKPMSDTLESAAEIIRICKEKKIKLQINHQRRFDPFYHSVKKLINSDKFGKIQHVNIYYGAGIANTGSHIFDLTRFFFNEIDWVKGFYSQNFSNNPSDPNIDGIIVCKNGIRCSINGFDTNNYGIAEFDIVGTKGRIRLNLVKSTAEYFEASHKQDAMVYRELVQKKYPTPKRREAIVLGLENLLYSLENNVEPLCRGEDGYSSLEIIIAMSESADKHGRKISLPLKKTNTYKIVSK
jgi:predicted dehydrogenase